MGKRKSVRNRNRKNNRPKQQAPDDYFSMGPLEFFKFGNTTITRSNATEEQVAIVHQKMAEGFLQFVKEIDELVNSIASQISHLPPNELLHRAWMEFCRLMVTGQGSEFDQISAMRMVDYVQSLMAAVSPAGTVEKLTDGDWEKLKTDVHKLFNRLSLEYPSYSTAYRKSQNPDLDMDLEDFRVRAELLWMNIRGKRYHVHERQALLDILQPHSDILVELYGIGADMIVDGLDNILSKLTKGFSQSFKDLNTFREEFFQRLEAQISSSQVSSTAMARDKVFEDLEFAQQRDKIMGELFGLDLFDVAKNTSFPEELIKDLTWERGQDTEFLAAGEFSGWPLRIWPIMKRPFIYLDGEAYCFDIFSLFDNIYRVLRRAVVGRKPEYSEKWNERQKQISEQLPLTYLEKLMPGAQIYSSVYYKHKVGSRPSEWHEADALIVFEDHLFVIEVKAGAFTYTSPANDLTAHLKSLKSLLETPARQGNRFVDYLESSPEVSIANHEHTEIAKLSRSSFRHITICAVTLDNFSDLAARAQHLTGVGISVGERAIWPLSIDDLRVYMEILDDPLVFLHFVEMRSKAGNSAHVELIDELDHLGLYIDKNDYALFAEGIIKKNEISRLNFEGYRKPIDNYFRIMLEGEKPEPIRQALPSRVQDIIDFLSRSDQRDRAELSSYLLRGSVDFRDFLAKSIQIALKENNELKRIRPMSYYGDISPTIYISSAGLSVNEEIAILHTRAVLKASGEESRVLIQLKYDENEVLIFARISHINLLNITDEQIQVINQASALLVEGRMKNVKMKGKIPPNSRCPCGSDKKFKKCHGSSL